MAASKEKCDIQITLEKLDLSARIKNKSSLHVGNFILIWPRMLIASRESQKKLRLSAGKGDWQTDPWHQKILFKERVEYDFALSCDITESVTETKITSFLRQVLAGLSKVGEVASDAAAGGGWQGELASLPWEYARKRFKEELSADLCAEGTMDFSARQLAADQTVEIPLCAPKDILRLEQPREERRPARRKILFRKGEQIGTATLRIQRLGE